MSDYEYSKERLSKLHVPDLKPIAKGFGIAVTGLRKDELITEIRKAAKKKPTTTKSWEKMTIEQLKPFLKKYGIKMEVDGVKLVKTELVKKLARKAAAAEKKLKEEKDEKEAAAYKKKHADEVKEEAKKMGIKVSKKSKKVLIEEIQEKKRGRSRSPQSRKADKPDEKKKSPKRSTSKEAKPAARKASRSSSRESSRSPKFSKEKCDPTKYNAKELKEKCEKLGIAKTGTKEELCKKILATLKGSTKYLKGSKAKSKSPKKEKKAKSPKKTKSKSPKKDEKKKAEKKKDEKKKAKSKSPSPKFSKNKCNPDDYTAEQLKNKAEKLGIAKKGDKADLCKRILATIKGSDKYLKKGSKSKSESKDEKKATKSKSGKESKDETTLNKVTKAEFVKFLEKANTERKLDYEMFGNTKDEKGNWIKIKKYRPPLIENDILFNESMEPKKSYTKPTMFLLLNLYFQSKYSRLPDYSYIGDNPIVNSYKIVEPARKTLREAIKTYSKMVLKSIDVEEKSDKNDSKYEKQRKKNREINKQKDKENEKARKAKDEKEEKQRRVDQKKARDELAEFEKYYKSKEYKEYLKTQKKK